MADGLERKNSFQQVIQKSWQSFSTMKCFLREAQRLENASWRLWHMHRNNWRKHGNVQELLNEFRGRQQMCVYCELVPAAYSCDGCCHDAYCVPCFQLVHKKGHLATHTAHHLSTMSDHMSSHSSEGICSSLDEPDNENIPAKTWEIKMDQAIKGLLDYKIPPLDDLSVHSLADVQVVDLVPAAPQRTFQSYMKTLEQSVSQAPCKQKKAICGNCKGDHMTFACPLLEAAMGGVDVGLRRCFTTLHNDNTSNSTHAFLGDEISVHGGIQHAYPSQAVSRSIVSSGQSFLGEEGSQRRGNQGLFSPEMFGSYENDDIINAALGKVEVKPYGSEFERIQEDVPAQDQDEPVFPVLEPHGDQSRTSKEWVLGSVHAEIDMDFCGKALTDPDVYSTWVVCRTCDSLWKSRFLVLYRNCIGEYLRDTDLKSTRPVGFCNLSNGNCSIDILNDTLAVLSYFISGSAMEGQARCSIRFKSSEEAASWKKHFNEAIELKLEDLYDLNPEIEKIVTHKKGLELGSGRFSAVRRAKRRKGNEDCALKIIDKEAFWSLVRNETERDDTIYREVLTQGILSDKLQTLGLEGRIVRLLSVFETQEMLVLELELMRGGDMFDVLAETGCLTESKAAILITELVESIRFCRQQGVAHRDVKLSNLALTAPLTSDNPIEDDGLQLGSLRLADFGMAALIQSDGKLRGRCGTPGYVAPEILIAGKHESYSSMVDMFSTGVVLYTILCGYEPFYGVTDKELVLANKTGVFEFHDPEWTSISAEAKDLVSKMMARNEKERISPEQALKHPFLSEIARKLNYIN